jgi:hypothetical protein
VNSADAIRWLRNGTICFLLLSLNLKFSAKPKQECSLIPRKTETDQANCFPNAALRSHDTRTQPSCSMLWSPSELERAKPFSNDFFPSLNHGASAGYLTARLSVLSGAQDAVQWFSACLVWGPDHPHHKAEEALSACHTCSGVEQWNWLSSTCWVVQKPAPTQDSLPPNKQCDLNPRPATVPSQLPCLIGNWLQSQYQKISRVKDQHHPLISANHISICVTLLVLYLVTLYKPTCLELHIEFYSQHFHWNFCPVFFRFSTVFVFLFISLPEMSGATWCSPHFFLHAHI